jgi:hypothetical protein
MRPVVIIALLSLTACAQADDQIRALPASIAVTPVSIEASGRWVTDTEVASPPLSKINTVQIICRKETMSCTEAVAALMTKEDEPRMPSSALFSLLSEYTIESWTDTKIRAKSEKKVADVILEFDLTNNTATRHHQETKARGNQTANPDFIVEWELL